MRMTWNVAILAVAVSAILAGCASEQPVDTGSPQFRSGTLNVQSKPREQVQIDDFNGKFYIKADEVLVIQRYWSQMFNNLTQPGAYGKFFNEFRLEMKKLANYYQDDRERERMMATAEQSFYEFCVGQGVAEEFRRWRAEIDAW